MSCRALSVIAAVGLAPVALTAPAAGSEVAVAAQVPPTPWASVAPGFSHSCGIQVDGTLWCWGYNGNGELGLGDLEARRVPTKVDIDNGAGWIDVATGRLHTCGVRANHTLWCWGYNGYGQLGLGDIVDRDIPTQVGSESDWAEVTLGDSHTCAVKTDHTLWCWGTNLWGEAGGYGGGYKSVPTQVDADDDWASVAAGVDYTCALRLDQTLWCWGINVSGELGVGSDLDAFYEPTEVSGGGQWLSVSPSRTLEGGNHTCAIKVDETLWCWGWHRYGALGLGGHTDQASPAEVAADQQWISVGSGGYHTCAVRADHTLWCWGRNTWYQLGRGGTHQHNLPRQVGDGHFWERVAIGGQCSAAFGRGLGLWGWGDNREGQLGLGDIAFASHPKRI